MVTKKYFLNVKKTSLFFCSILFHFLINNSSAQITKKIIEINKNDNTLLWQISGNKLTKPSYLFGTFHLICKSDIPFGAQLKTLVKNTDEIYMELDMDDPETMASGLKLMNMRGDTTLDSILSAKDYAKLKNYFNDSLQMPIAFFNKMKPYFLMSMLYPKMLPCKTLSGVEQELTVLAKENKKHIVGLETMAFQAAIFDTIPYAQQANELLKTIDSINDYKIYFKKMVNVYKSQKLHELKKLMEEGDSFGLENNNDILVVNRNKTWVKKLKTIMKIESVFVAVGAGHLVGENGLINLLRKQGYILKPIKN